MFAKLHSTFIQVQKASRGWTSQLTQHNTNAEVEKGEVSEKMGEAKEDKADTVELGEIYISSSKLKQVSLRDLQCTFQHCIAVHSSASQCSAQYCPAS